MNRKIVLHLLALAGCLLCYISAAAAEAYAVYTEREDHYGVLTFRYDNNRASCTGLTYDLNTGNDAPGWSGADGIALWVHEVDFAPSFGNYHPTSTAYWFAEMKNLEYIEGEENLNTDKVTTMRGMFEYCYVNLTSLFPCFNTSNVTDMSYMFSNCWRLSELILEFFNTSSVTNMEGMFEYCEDLTELDLSNFNTSKVTNMKNMFKGCEDLTTITVSSPWNVSAVTQSTDMFKDCTNLVGSRGTTYNANYTNKSRAHVDGGTTNPGYLSGDEAYACYTASNLTLTFYCDNLRSSRTGYTYDLNIGSHDPEWYSDEMSWEITRVVFSPSFADARPTSTYKWFSDMPNLTTIRGMKEYLNTSEVTTMSHMFYNCSSLTSLDVSGFNTAKVTDMSYMFESCGELTTLNLSTFNTAKVSNMREMFRDCSKLVTIYVLSSWTTTAVSSSSQMFKNCTKIKGGKGTAYNANYIDKTYARIDGGTSNPGYLTEKPIEAYACYTPSNTTLTFYYDNNRDSRTGTTYDLNTGNNTPGWYDDDNNERVTKVVFNSSFSGARPTSTCYWFNDMGGLTTITGMKEYLNTSEVTSMYGMFDGCYSLTSLDVSGFNTAKVTNMRYMFNECELTTLDLSSFNTVQVANMEKMFRECSNLTTIYVGSGWTTTAVSSSSQMFSNCTKIKGGKGTTYNASHVDKAYAHIDGGTSNPGYLTAKGTTQPGDVSNDGEIDVNDVTRMISCILNDTPVDLAKADMNGDNVVDVLDVTLLIAYILNN